MNDILKTILVKSCQNNSLKNIYPKVVFKSIEVDV